MEPFVDPTGMRLAIIRELSQEHNRTPQALLLLARYVCQANATVSKEAVRVLQLWRGGTEAEQVVMAKLLTSF